MTANTECGMRDEERKLEEEKSVAIASLFRTPHSAMGVQHSSEPGALATGLAPLLPARVETEDGRQHFVLFGPGPQGSLRLVSTSILLGKKVRVAILQTGDQEHLIGTARVLRTLRLSERLYENGAAIVMAGSVTQQVNEKASGA
jgi:hypothetical protein